MQLTNKSGKIWLFATVFLCLLFIAIKISFLTLPCSGDEAYPYADAIHYQIEHGVSLSPAAMPADLGTGHPTLYYFLQAAWMKMVGTEMWAARILPLFISVLLLFRIFFFGRRFFSPAIGFFCALLFASRSIFFVQSSMMLPEVLLSFLLLSSIQFYFERKWLAYALYSSLLVWTKEPALLFIGLFGLFEIRRSVILHSKITLTLKNLLFTAVPLVAALGFYTWQKIEMGWFLYPRHVSYISFKFSDFIDKLFVLYGESMFVFYGGVFVILTCLLFFILNLVRKNKSEKEEKEISAFLFAALLAYMLFCSLNFSSPRYVLCLFPLFFFLTLMQVFKFFRQKEKIAWLISILLTCINIGYLIDVRANGDCDLRNAEACLIRKRAIDYCLNKKGWKEKKIYAPFFMDHYMTKPF
ncbi:MAG: glycosyltransferase family 39 protein, partial [Bacteroidia bacterium]|nr:glycosyltransferase family 39 protein [Bacteroidia bacterium]